MTFLTTISKRKTKDQKKSRHHCHIHLETRHGGSKDGDKKRNYGKANQLYHKVKISCLLPQTQA